MPRALQGLRPGSQGSAPGRRVVDGPPGNHKGLAPRMPSPAASSIPSPASAERGKLRGASAGPSSASTSASATA